MRELLDREWDDVDDLAAAVLTQAWQEFTRRGVWCVVMDAPGVGVSAHGPYQSKTEAMKVIGSEIVAPGPGSASAYVRVLLRPDGNTKESA